MVPMHTPAAFATPGALATLRETMFTRSCSDVKVPLLATERIFVDVHVGIATGAAAALCEEEMGHVRHRFTPRCPAGCGGKRQHTPVPGARGGGSDGLQYPRAGYGRRSGRGSGHLTGGAGEHLRLCPALPQQRPSLGLSQPMLKARTALAALQHSAAKPRCVLRSRGGS